MDKWYSELNRSPRKGLSDDTAVYERPYWYKSHELEGGYFGYWCIEAVAAVKAFGLDDSLCLGHPNYPGDLLRPDGATTHPRPPAQEDIPSPSVASRGEDVLEPPVGLFTRWFGRHKPRK